MYEVTTLFAFISQTSSYFCEKTCMIDIALYDTYKLCVLLVCYDMEPILMYTLEG